MRKPVKPNRPKGYEEPKFNEKTGVWLFQKKYRFKDQFGKTKQSRTPWFTSQADVIIGMVNPGSK